MVSVSVCVNFIKLTVRYGVPQTRRYKNFVGEGLPSLTPPPQPNQLNSRLKQQHNLIRPGDWARGEMSTCPFFPFS